MKRHFAKGRLPSVIAECDTLLTDVISHVGDPRRLPSSHCLVFRMAEIRDARPSRLSVWIRAACGCLVKLGAPRRSGISSFFPRSATLAVASFRLDAYFHQLDTCDGNRGELSLCATAYRSPTRERGLPPRL